MAYILVVRLVAVLVFGFAVKGCTASLHDTLYALHEYVHGGDLGALSPWTRDPRGWLSMFLGRAVYVSGAILAILVFAKSRSVARRLWKEHETYEAG